VLGAANCKQVLSAARLAGVNEAALTLSLLRNEIQALPVIGARAG
jgi:hypothetical protein